MKKDEGTEGTEGEGQQTESQKPEEKKPRASRAKAADWPFKFISRDLVPHCDEKGTVHVVIPGFDRFMSGESRNVKHEAGAIVVLYGDDWVLAENGDAHSFLVEEVADAYLKAGRVVAGADHREQTLPTDEERKRMQQTSPVIKA